MEKKNNLVTIIIAVIFIIIIALIVINNNKKVKTPESEAPTQTETELNNAIKSDTTASINSNLDSIDVNDTSDAELNIVDQEIQKL